jgi:polar amino acid transport system ATP-binding protein
MIPMIVVERVHKSFGHTEVLKGIDLTVSTGQVVCLVGPSGSGKSTLLRCVNNLESVDAGHVWVDGQLMGYRVAGSRLHRLNERAARRQRRDIGMVFQHFNLFPHMTVLENVAMAPVVAAGEDRASAAARATALLDRVGLATRRYAYPRHLSGGQQQRVAIARALALQPKLLLFDEPTSALDPELVGEVLTVMTDLAADGITMLVVTHELAFARDVADTLVFMDAGRIVESGPPAQLIARPTHERTRSFLSRIRSEQPATP